MLNLLHHTYYQLHPFFFVLYVFIKYFMPSIAVLPHSPGVVYYHLLLNEDTIIPGVASCSFFKCVYRMFLCIGDINPIHPQPLETCGPLQESNALYMPHHNPWPLFESKHIIKPWILGFVDGCSTNEPTLLFKFHISIISIEYWLIIKLQRSDVQ